MNETPASTASPVYENPVKTLRVSCGLTQRALASLAGVTEQVVLKTEQGLYPSIPPSMYAVARVLDPSIDLDVMAFQYEQWILQELNTVRLPLASESVQYDTPVGFINWRAHVCLLNHVQNSVNGFCKLMKINPYVIQKYEAGRLKQVPVQLIERIAYIKGEW